MTEVERRLGETVAGWGEELGRDAGETLTAGGKRMRPLLVLLCAGRGAGQEAIRAATAIELVHMATLVHDDVLDDAPLRRGLPTVFASSGRRRAVAAGDLLFSRAFAILATDGDGPEPSAVLTLSGISGSGPLVAELRYLVRHLRPDVEEELSRVIGDVAAQRIGDGVRAIARWQRDAAARAGEALVDYVVDERQMLARRPEVAQFAADVARLTAALAALEQRIARLD